MTAAPRPTGAGGITLTGFVGEEGATSLAKNGTYNSQNVSDATSVNYGVLTTSDFTATGGTSGVTTGLSESAPLPARAVSQLKP